MTILSFLKQYIQYTILLALKQFNSEFKPCKFNMYLGNQFSEQEINDAAAAISYVTVDDAPIILGDLEPALLNKKNQLGSNFTVVINGDEAASLQDLVAVMEVLKNLQIPSMTISSKKRS